MINLKDRIALLKRNTTSAEAIEIANLAMDACKTNGFMDSAIAESLVKDLESIDDAEVKKFIQRESRFVAINNLGVKEAYNNLMEGDLMHYPTVKPLIENAGRSIKSLPEFITAPLFVNTFSQYNWNLELRNDLASIVESMDKYSEDIKLATFVYEFKKGSGSYLSKMFENELDTYFVERTPEARKIVLEKINPYLFDNGMKQLHDILIESADGFQVEANGQVSIDKIYSPVIINESSEIFFASGRFMIKENNTISTLSPADIAKLPTKFVELAGFMSQPNVKVFENKIQVYTSNKTVDIIFENDSAKLKLNGKDIEYDKFTRYFMNEGIFRQADNNILKQVAALYESANSIYEIDYAKRLISKTNEGRWVDVFKVDKNVFLTKVNVSEKVNDFVSNINANQTKKLILEYLRFDISESLRDLLPEENAKIETLNNQHGELSEAITMLTNKKSEVLEQVNANPILKASKEVKELLEAIEIELNSLNEQKSAVLNMIKSLTTVGMFETSEFTDEDQVNSFWKIAENADKVIYFTQKDTDGKFIIGKQTKSLYEQNENWEPIAIEQNGLVAIDKAKKFASANENGIYFETDDAKIQEASKVADPDGVKKLDKQNKSEVNEFSDDIKKNEDTVNPLESGDEVKLKNGALGVVQGNDSDNNTIILMDDGKTVSVPQEFIDEIEIIKKKSNENDPEIKVDDNKDGDSVEIKESNDGWIEGTLIDKNGNEKEQILVDASDYTSKGDNDKVNIKAGKNLDKSGTTLRKFIKISE